MPRHISEKAKNASKKVISIAHKIREEHPNMQWKTCMKEAGKIYREEKEKA